MQRGSYRKSPAASNGSKTVDTTHAEALELIAKAFGYDNWNILSAKIETVAAPPAGDQPSLSIAASRPAPPPKTLYCSFCGKSQHEVRMLIGGPPPLFICDECADVCAAMTKKASG